MLRQIERCLEWSLSKRWLWHTILLDINHRPIGTSSVPQSAVMLNLRRPSVSGHVESQASLSLRPCWISGVPQSPVKLNLRRPSVSGHAESQASLSLRSCWISGVPQSPVKLNLRRPSVSGHAESQASLSLRSSWISGVPQSPVKLNDIWRNIQLICCWMTPKLIIHVYVLSNEHPWELTVFPRPPIFKLLHPGHGLLFLQWVGYNRTDGYVQ